MRHSLLVDGKTLTKDTRTGQRLSLSDSATSLMTILAYFYMSVLTWLACYFLWLETTSITWRPQGYLHCFGHKKQNPSPRDKQCSIKYQ